MRNIDLEKFYSKIDKSIELVAAVSGKAHYKQIIKSCRLKPIEISENHFDWKPKIYDLWIDEFGYVINIRTAVISKFEIKPNSTDLFYGNSREQLLSNGRVALFAGNNYPAMFSIIGQDNYIRAIAEDETEIIRLSPLSFGLAILQKLCSNAPPYEILLTKEYTITKEFEKCVITRLPSTLDVNRFFRTGEIDVE